MSVNIVELLVMLEAVVALANSIIKYSNRIRICIPLYTHRRSISSNSR